MFDVKEKTINNFTDAFDKHEITSKQLVILYAKEIANRDSVEGGYNSVLEFNCDALHIADQLDKERALGKIRSKLHGIPILLKDNINTADLLHTSAGSLALANNFAPYDAKIVSNLRKAGAIILGKANMTEFANYMSYGVKGGYSSRGGIVYSPFGKEFSPSGSSAGSGVAVSANLCSVSIGTETSGSILCPARSNSIVGFKPTRGIVSNSGIIPISITLDTPGPMTRTVSDAAILLEGMVEEQYYEDFSGSLNKSRLEGIKIGINRGNIEIVDKETLSNFEEVLLKLKSKGAIIIDDINKGYYKDISTIMRYEFKKSLNYYLSTLSSDFEIKTLRDIIDFNTANKDKALKYKQKLLQYCQSYTSGKLSEPEYLNAIVKSDEALNEITNMMDDKNIDVILNVCEYTNIAPFTGLPAASIPFGIKKDGTPIGSYWMARKYDDKKLLNVIYAVEKLLKARKVPKY